MEEKKTVKYVSKTYKVGGSSLGITVPINIRDALECNVGDLCEIEIKILKKKEDLELEKEESKRKKEEIYRKTEELIKKEKRFNFN